MRFGLIGARWSDHRRQRKTSMQEFNTIKAGLADLVRLAEPLPAPAPGRP
jgi:hypothetical protein